MDRIQLYKEFYFKELSRKVELDNAITLPLAVLTAIISLSVYIFNDSKEFTLLVCSLISLDTGFEISFMLWYYTKSYFNHGKSNMYQEIVGMNELYKYDKLPNKAIDFDENLEEKLSTAAGHYFKINISRTEDLAKGKKHLFNSIRNTYIFILIYIISIIINK